MTITTETLRDEDGTALGEMVEAEGVAVYRDVTGYLALDVPGRLDREKAIALHTLLGKVLAGDIGAAGAATGRP